MASTDAGKVECWVVGKFGSHDRISVILFGTFTQSLSPPLNANWIYIGKNVDEEEYEGLGKLA